MARRGQKRKNGHRYANGNLKQPNAAERHRTAQELIDLEKAVVLAQPHRRGDLSQHRESPLGRLVAKWKLRKRDRLRRHVLQELGLQFGNVRLQAHDVALGRNVRLGGLAQRLGKPFGLRPARP